MNKLFLLFALTWMVAAAAAANEIKIFKLYLPDPTISAENAVNVEMLQQYLPIAKMLNAKMDQQAVAALERIAPDNLYASATLIVIYSRGYAGQQIDYRKVKKYWENSERVSWVYQIYDGFMNYERHRVCDYMPLYGWNALPFGIEIDQARNEHVIKPIPLTGEHLFKDCCEEQMLMLGGGVPGMVLATCRLNSGSMYRHYLATELQLGSCQAMIAPYHGLFLHLLMGYSTHSNTLRPADFERVVEAADMGHIPAMIIAGQILRRNQYGIPVDLGRARRYFEGAQKTIEKYRTAGCDHYCDEQKFIETMLKQTPDPAWSRSEIEKARLAAIKSQGYDPKLFDAAIAQRSPSYAKYLEGEELLFKDRARALVLLKEAAEAGESAALSRVIFEVGGRTPDAWYWLYLAGRNGMRSQEKMSYYQQAMAELSRNRHRMKPEEYRKALTLLSEHDEHARRMLAMLDQEPKPVAAPAELELKFDEKLWTLEREKNYDADLFRFTARTAVANDAITLSLPEKMSRGRFAILVSKPEVQSKLKGNVTIVRGNQRPCEIWLGPGAANPGDEKMQAVSVKTTGLAVGEQFVVAIYDSAKLGKKPDDPRTAYPALRNATAEDQAVFAMASEDQITVHGIEEELCTIREENGRLQILVVAMGEPIDARVIIVFPVSGKYDFMRYPRGMSGSMSFRHGVSAKLTAYLRDPNAVIPLPAEWPLPVYLYAPLKAIVLDLKLENRRAYGFFLDFVQ